jgi:nucleoporin-like protein 2
MRKELCRNFQRGSCRYGENCRFLHPQQAKPNNPFGFGTQNQQQQQQQQQQNSSNPFGFGVQSGGSSRPNQFQNTWSRTASTPTGGGAAASTQQTGKQTQPADHKCTDPAACKRVMQDDFKNERPMWKLTCYGHWKYFPCDVTGDISYEELRAVAYEEAKRGIPLQSIVERERNLQNSKIAEFENFLRNPYKGSVTANQSPFAATTPSIFPQSSQINSPSPAFSGFNQQTAFSNTNAGGLRYQLLWDFSNFHIPKSLCCLQTNSRFPFFLDIVHLDLRMPLQASINKLHSPIPMLVESGTNFLHIPYSNKFVLPL